MKSGIIKKAIELAEASTYRFQVGAVVFKGSRILGTGKNEIRHCSKINPKYKNHLNAIHAEQNAILSCKNWVCLSGASILVVRLTKKSVFSMARPCSMCMKMIQHLNIKDVYYSTTDGQIILEKM